MRHEAGTLKLVIDYARVGNNVTIPCLSLSAVWLASVN